MENDVLIIDSYDKEELESAIRSNMNLIPSWKLVSVHGVNTDDGVLYIATLVRYNEIEKQ